MKSSRNFFLLMVLLSVTIAGTSFGQSFNFRAIRKEQGLPGGEVYKIIQDSKGYIWGVTDGGVFKYNGSTFKNFSEEDSLPGLTFFGLYEDYKNRIWVSSSNGSIGYISNDRYFSIAANDEIRKFLLFGQSLITDIYVDEGDTLWLGTTYHPLKVWPDKNYREVEHIRSPLLENNRIIRQFGNGNLVGSSSYYEKPRPLEEDKNRTSYFSTICIYDGIKSGIININWKIKFGTICNLTAVEQSQNTLLFSYGNKLYKSVDKILRDSVEFNNRILRIVKDRFGDVWICLDKSGVVLYKNGDLHAVPVNFLTEASVSDVLVDHEGSLWVSTLDKGIYFSPSLQIQYYGHLPGLQQKILAVQALDSSVLAINESGAGIVVNPKGEAQDAFHVGSNITIGIYKIKPFRQGISIIGLTTAGLNKDFSFRDIITDRDVPLYLQDMIEYEGDTNLMLSHSHLYWFKGMTLIKQIRLPGRGICFIRDDKNTILIGMLEGLTSYKNNVFTSPDGFKATETRINYLYKDQHQQLWVCTKGKGLFYRKDGRWNSITTANGLISNLCNVIIETRPGVYFVGTSSGLTRLTFEGDSVSCINYNVTNGLSGNEINSLSYGNNWLWIGTSTGLNRMPVTGILPNLIPPPVYLQHLLINDNTPVKFTEGMRFAHKENNLTFFVDMLSFKRQKGAILHYTLNSDGFALNRTIEGNSFELQNIPPGDYTLKIYGVNSYGIESVTPVELHFQVMPPFWKTWWFLLATTTLLAATIALYLRWRLNVQYRKQKEQSGIERKLAEFRLEALRAQMNPHFVFNAINGIQRKILQQDPHEAYTYLTKFSQLIRLFLTSTNQQYIPISKELEALRLYVEFEQLRFDDSFDFELIVDRETEEEDVQIPSMIIQPFVENAIWHGLMPLNNIRKGKVRVIIEQSDEHFRITISDNGIGFEKSMQQPKKSGHTSLGIELTRNRLELLTGRKGIINVEKQPDGSDGAVVVILI